MNKIAVALACLVSLAAPAAASAAEGPFMVRLRGVYILPADKNTNVVLSKDVISVDKKAIPEVDISYFFTPNLSAELILTYPQKHDVELEGSGKVGDFSHLPPCLTAQWHFLPGGVANPYVGLGLNFTLITSQNIADKALELDNYSLGVAAQAGVDVKVAEQWYVNADVKYATIRADLKRKSDGAKLTTVKVDPWLFGLGVGYRF